MRVEIDADTFDENQIALLGEIIKCVDSQLRNAIPDIAKRKETVYDIVFNIGAILDNSAAIEGKNGFVSPVLTFAKVEDDFSVLVSNGNTSYIHEYAPGFVEEFYENHADGDSE